MGDRAYVRITCRREDVDRFEQLGFVEDDAESDIAMSMVDSEANYAHYSALTALAKTGTVFFGWHEAGCEYCNGSRSSPLISSRFTGQSGGSGQERPMNS